MNLNDTIAAVSTPKGKGGVAMIRISGANSSDVLSKVFRPAGTKYADKSAIDLPPRRAVYGTIISRANGEKKAIEIDSGVAVLYRAPASYTGEDMAEITCHGGTYITGTVLSAALAAGARHAEAGEFTRRAFLNGKLTLTEAEAVGTLLDADTEERMLLASSAVRGRLSGEISEIADRLSDVMTALYAAIDYPEEDVGDEGEREALSAVTAAENSVRRLLSTYRRGRAVAEGVRCVICGSPNAGKSSLYNLMAGEELAIVTDIPGTTRDVLRETISFGGVTLRLADTAGLRETGDQVEGIGVRRAEEEIRSAELLISVFDSSRRLTEEERLMIDEYPNCARVAVINKSDLPTGLTKDEIEFIKLRHDKTVVLSCFEDIKNNDCRGGIDDLAKAVGDLYDAGSVSVTDDAVIWSARQEATLRRAAEYLTEAKTALEAGDYTDAVCTLCEGALAELRGTDGRGVGEEIIDGIFSRFCVGK